jgi:predicted membrane protein
MGRSFIFVFVLLISFYLLWNACHILLILILKRLFLEDTVASHLSTHGKEPRQLCIRMIEEPSFKRQWCPKLV